MCHAYEYSLGMRLAGTAGMNEIDRKIVLAGKLKTIGDPLRKVFTKEGWSVFEFHGAEDAEREIHL